ncbi:MAG: RNA polymerase sigma factor SigF [Actinomycetota bacterium]|nr:RNA polymerase sigma factor SigF [Actinomycetota bacterium]
MSHDRSRSQRSHPNRPGGPAVASGPDFHWLDTAFARLRVLPPAGREHADLRNRIVEECLPLADRIARRYDQRGEAHDDLVQVARLGLISAVNRYNPSLGSGFLAFAVPTMVGEVKRYFRDHSWSVNVPRRLKDIYPALGPATAELTQRLGRAPTPTELADELGVDRADLVAATTAAAGLRATSIDRRYSGYSGEDDAPPLIDRLGELDAALDLIEDRNALHMHLDALPEREYHILIMRFFGSLTQSEIAERMGISQMHVSRLLAQSLHCLREAMTGRDPDSESTVA